jgi:hypothetical protein
MSALCLKLNLEKFNKITPTSTLSRMIALDLYHTDQTLYKILLILSKVIKLFS